MNRVRNGAIPLSIFFSTVFIAVFCDIKAINSYLVAGVGEMGESESGPMAILYMISGIGAIITGVLSYQWKDRKIPLAATFILVWVTVFYFVTQFFIAPPYTRLMLFVVLTLVSFILPHITQIEGRLFLRFSMLLALPAVFRVNEIFQFSEYYDSITMGQSYAFLFPVVAAIVYFFIYFRDDSVSWKIISILLFVVNGVYAYYLVFFGSRGSVFAMLAVVLFLLVFKPSDNGVGIKTKKGGFAIVGTVAVVVAISFATLISVFQDVLANYGISLYFLDKFLDLESGGDITNGRQAIYALAFSDIAQHPFLGMGFDQFFNNHGNVTGIAYPHNFIIQILYDGGIVLLLVLGIPIIKGLKRVWKTCTLNEYAVVAALVFSAVPRALFSGDLWQNGPLWMLFGIVLCRGFVVNNKKEYLQ